MHGKKRTRATVVTESVAQASLRRAPGRGLAADEERLLRMRLGASAPRTAPLERLAVASDAEIEVLAYEIEAWLRMKELRAASATGRPASSPTTVSRAKEKIVRALRRKR